MFKVFTAIAIQLIISCDAIKASDELPMIAAARKRQQAIRSLEVKFHLEKVLEPGGESVTYSHGEIVKRYPETRMVGTSENRLVLEGVKFRAELVHPLSGNKLIRRSEVNVFDGDLHFQSLDGLVLAQGNAPDGGIIARRPADRVHLPVDVTAFRFAVRVPVEFVDPDWRLWGEWRSVGRRGSLFGSKTDEYELRTSNLEEYTRIWTDPARDNVIVAVRIGSLHQLDLGYRFDAESSLWLPSGWRESVSDRNGLKSTTTATVTSIAVNRPIPASEFSYAFPEGTPVTDFITKTRFVVGKNGERLNSRSIEEKPAPPVDRSKPVRKQGLYIVLGVIGVLVVVLVVLRMNGRWRSARVPG